MPKRQHIDRDAALEKKGEEERGTGLEESKPNSRSGEIGHSDFSLPPCGSEALIPAYKKCALPSSSREN